ELQHQRAVPFANHEHAVEPQQDQQRRDDARNDPAHGCPPLSAESWLAAGTTTPVVDASAPAALAAAPGCAGRLMMLRPSKPSITLGLSAITCSMVSSHSRLRVTSGAAWYCFSSRSKRSASPSARAMRSAL